MEFFLIYLYIFVTRLSVAVAIGLGVSAALFAIGMFVTAMHYADKRKFSSFGPDLNKAIKHKKKIALALIFSVVFITAVPTKKDIAWIIGGGVTLKVAQNDQIQQLPENVAEAVNRFLESVNERGSSTQETD